MKSLTVRFSSSPVPLHDVDDVVDVFKARKASRHRPLVFFVADDVAVVVVVDVELDDVVVVVVGNDGLIVKRFDEDDEGASPSRCSPVLFIAFRCVLSRSC